MVTLIIAFRDPLYALGARAALQREGGFSRLQTVTHPAMILPAFARHVPDVLVVDSEMLATDPSLVSEVHRRYPETRVLVVADPDNPACRVLTGSEPRGWCTLAGDSVPAFPACAAMKEDGATACLPRSMVVSRLAEAVRQVMGMERTVRSLPRLGDAAAPPRLGAESLTPKERLVLRALADGLANRDIADRLGIREQTVKNHVSRIMAKLDLHRRAALVGWVLRNAAEL